MKKLLLSVLVVAMGCGSPSSSENTENDTTEVVSQLMTDQEMKEVSITPIVHATFVLQYGDLVVYNDPYGGAAAFAGLPTADLVLISDIHGDHLNLETLDSLDLSEAKIVVPQAVAQQMPESYRDQLVILANGEETNLLGIGIKAIPMYNLPEAEDSRHVKGRGNGYVLTLDQEKIYIAGDTEDIPEMRELQNIDIAFVPMNMPYTMPVEQAADGVIAFAPEVVYPYHYRGQDGLSDVTKFKEIVDGAGKTIEVRLLDWYSQAQ